MIWQLNLRINATPVSQSVSIAAYAHTAPGHMWHMQTSTFPICDVAEKQTTDEIRDRNKLNPFRARSRPNQPKTRNCHPFLHLFFFWFLDLSQCRKACAECRKTNFGQIFRQKPKKSETFGVAVLSNFFFWGIFALNLLEIQNRSFLTLCAFFFVALSDQSMMTLSRGLSSDGNWTEETSIYVAFFAHFVWCLFKLEKWLTSWNWCPSTLISIVVRGPLIVTWM